MPPTIRIAVEDDAPGIAAIYAPVVHETAISFELEPPGVEEIGRRVRTTLERHPWLVCEQGGALLGYAYASAHRSRAAYQWAVDVSIYIDGAARRRGVGRALYTSLLRLLALQGYYSAYAGIALPNQASVGLHESLGFELVGIYREVGYKLGAWHDVGWWQLSLRARGAEPPPPRAMAELAQSPGWAAALEAGERLFT